MKRLWIRDVNKNPFLWMLFLALKVLFSILSGALYVAEGILWVRCWINDKWKGAQ